MSQYPYRIPMDTHQHENYHHQINNISDYFRNRSKKSLCQNFLYGMNIPPDDLGRNGNLYLDLCVNEFYLKIDNCWHRQIYEKHGCHIFTDAQDPNNDIGCNGDFFINTITGSFFIKECCIWRFLGTLQGLVGEKGQKGDKGPCCLGPKGEKGQAGEKGERGSR